MGDGYYVHIVCKHKNNEEASSDVSAYLGGRIKGINLLNSLNGTLNYQVSREGTSLSTILGALVASPGDDVAKTDFLKSIEDWGVENTT